MLYTWRFPSAYAPVIGSRAAQLGVDGAPRTWRSIIVEKRSARWGPPARATSWRTVIRRGAVFPLDTTREGTVQNLMVLRFANGISSRRNRRYIDQVRSRRRRRGRRSARSYYEGAGAFAHVQNTAAGLALAGAADPLCRSTCAIER